MDSAAAAPDSKKDDAVTATAAERKVSGDDEATDN